MKNLTDPVMRQASRAALHILAVLAFIGLLYILTYHLRGNASGLIQIARGTLIILGMIELFYGAENLTRAIKLTGPIGISAEFGAAEAAKEAAEKVAGAAVEAKNEIKDGGA